MLRRRLEALGAAVKVREITLEEAADFSGADFIYMGAGTERRQKNVLTAGQRYAPALREAAEGGAVLLFTGNAMETLGASVTDAAGQVWPGFGLAEFATVETDRRVPGDVVAVSTPVLVKNPDFLDLVTRRLFARRGWACPEALPALPHQREAYEVTRRELERRIGT